MDFLADIKKVLKDWFIFKEPDKIEQFILKEVEGESLNKQKDANEAGKADGKGNEGNGNSSEKKGNGNPPEKKESQGHKKRGIKTQFAPINTVGGNSNDNEQKCECSDSKSGGDNNGDGEEEKKTKDVSTMTKVSKTLSDNIAFLKKKYTIPDNGDIVLREFDIVAKNKSIPACMIFIDGMTSRDVIDLAILQPLMLLSNIEIKGKEEDIGLFVRNHLLPHNQIKMVNELSKVIDEVNFGGCGIFIDGIDVAFAADVKGWQGRGVSSPNTEMVIRGPQEGFNELLRTNTGLIRKILKDEDVIAESISIGRRSKTPCSLMYIKDIANDSLVAEVRRRLKGIKIDYLFDSGELEQLLEDNSYLAVPQIIATERPDRVAAMLTEGKVAVVVHGSPFVLVMPTTHIDLFHSPEDSYIRFPYANLLRIIRIIAIAMSLLLPGLYIAITNFHQEMIPTDLLFAIEASREKVPFPSVVELLIMEFAFELIREAGIRIPGPIGPTLGIVGGLILGQAAVAANIVSPIMIIIVAVTGIGSFAIPNFSLGYAYRILRFVYIFLSATAGFLGITFGLYLQGLWFAASKSFGVPFMTPIGPMTKGGFADQILRAPIWKQEERPDFLNVKDNKKQPKISRQWADDDKN
nr:spore germination protein [Acetivibrio cellulolyticus]